MLNMSYEAVSCCPQADCSNGLLVLNERRESLPVLGEVVWIFGSTILYPAVLVITTLAELYLAIDWSIHKYKDWSLGRKINKVESCSDDMVEMVKAQRLQKLEERKIRQHDEMIETLSMVQDLWPDLKEQSLIEKIEENYADAVKQAALEDYSFSAVSFQARWEGKLKVIRAYERTVEEIKYYNNKSTGEVREIFSERYKFLQILCQLNQHIDRHYLRILLIAQIPVIGLLCQAHSKYTTKKSLEETNLIEQYNSYMKNHKWLKPY